MLNDNEELDQGAQEVSEPLSGSPVEEGQDELRAAQDHIEALMEKVTPILQGLFKAADEKNSVWFKKADARVLTEWILSTLNIAQHSEQRLVQAQLRIHELERELAKFSGKKRLWQPGL